MWENALDIPPNKLSLPSFHILSHHVPMNDTSTENLQISNDIYRYLQIGILHLWGLQICRWWSPQLHGNSLLEANGSQRRQRIRRSNDVWFLKLTMQHFFKSKIGIFLVSMDLCYQDIFMFSCPKDLDCWAHVCQTFDSRMEQIRGEYFKELRIMQAQRNSSSCFEVLGWLPRPPVQGIVAQDETWFDQTAVLLSLSHGTRRN